MVTLCPEGKAEITITDQEELDAYEDLLDYYDGDELRAYEAFYRQYRTNENELLKDRISSYAIEGFTVSQQQQTVDLMKWYTMKMLTWNDGEPLPAILGNDGLPNIGKIKSAVRNVIDNQIREKHSNSESRQEAIDKILENYNQFWRRNHERLKEIGLDVDNRTGGIKQIAGGDFVRRNWDDNARFEIDPKNTASAKVKAALSFIPKVGYVRDESGNIEKENGVPKKSADEGFLGPRFASLDTIHDNIGRALSDFVPPFGVDKFEAYVDKLKEEFVENNAQLERAIEEIVERGKNDDTFKFDFVNAFGKTYTKDLTVTFKPNVYIDQRTGRQVTSGWTIRVFDTNRTSQKNALKQQWFENQKDLPIVSQDQEGDLRIDKSAVRDLRDQYINDINDAFESTDDKKSEEALSVVQEYLGMVGITVPMGVLEDVANNPEIVSTQDHTWNYHIGPNNGGLASKGLMGAIFNTLAEETDVDNVEESEYGKLGLNNPIYGRDSQGLVDSLASLSADVKSSVYAPSYINGENNQVFALQDHTILTKTFGKLTQRPDKALEGKGVFNRESKILDAIQNNDANIREALDLHYTDVLREYRRTTGTSYDRMSTAEKELTKLGLFQRPQRNGRVRFLSPTLSDKTREYIITLPRVQELFNEDKWLTARNTTITEDGELNLYNQQDGNLYSGLEGRVLYNMAKGEIKRIRNIQNWLRDNNPSDHPLGEDYVEAAQRFLLFPELNAENLSDEDVSKIYRTNSANEISDLKNPVNNDIARDTIERVLLDRLSEKVEKTKNRWREMGIADGDSANEFMMDSTYLRNIPFKMSDGNRKLTYAALDYQLSNRFFNSNILQMLPGDPAQHVKGDFDADSLEAYEETMTNLQKRLANHIAPGLTADWANGEDTVRIATLNDRIVASKHWDQYKSMLDGDLIDLYGEFNEDGELEEGIESTDAQEYTTFKEHLIMARSHGKVRKPVFDALMNKIDEVRQDPNNPNNYFKIKDVFRENENLREEEYEDFYLMPHKPVLVGEEYYDHLNSSHVLYRKTSSWPLIPEMTKGTDLDNLRLAMEGNGEQEKVQRAAFQSADKLGAYNPVDAFEDNERKTFKKSSDYFKSFDEVDNPNNANVQVVNRDNLALQFELPYNDKGVKSVSQMNRLLPHDIKDIPDFLIDGEEMNGRQVGEYKQDLRKQMFNTARQQLFDDLGVNVIETDSGEKYEFEDMEALQSVLLDEARARDWDPSSIDALELTEEGEFIIPLSFTPNTESVESLLNSLIDNRIIEQRMYGSSYVQTTGAGWHGIGDNSPIAVTESYDPEQGVQHIRKDENGEVQPAQAMIPWNFKDENGNLLDINDYTKTVETEDGGTRRVIDDEKLDPQIRKMIGARIPYQSKSSSMPLEIVGFLPPTVKKLMVVSDETVAQMGSDFDVDKVTTYEYKYTLTPDGRLAASQSGDSNMDEMDVIKKKYKDLHWEVLTHPEVMPQVIQPLDSPYLSDEADKIEDMKPQSDDRTDPLDPHQQVDDHDNQQAGNDLIGIFSNFSNLNAMIEPYPQKMRGSIPDGDGGSRTVDRIVTYKRREDGNTSEYRLNQIGGDNADVQMPDGSTGTIGDVLEMLQNASLDNAKELVLDKINATTNTANVISALAMLNNGTNGIPLDQLARFFAQPAIKEIDKEIDRLQSQINDEFISGDTQEKAIQRVLSRLAENYATNEEGKIDQEKYESIYNSINREEIRNNEVVVNAEIPSLRDLTSSLKKSFDSSDTKFVRTQRDVIDAYLGLHEISKALNQIQGTVNWGNRNGPGKSLLHSKNKAQAYDNLPKNKIFDNPTSIVKNANDSLTEWGSAAHNSFILANELYGDLFHYNSTVFERVKSEMDQQTDNGISPDKALRVFRNLRSFVFSSDGILNMEGFTVEGERKRLLQGENNIATKVKKAQDDWGMENFFIQRLRPTQPEGEGDLANVDYLADKGEKLDEIRVIQDFAGMLTSNDDRKRELARDLVRYSFLVGGGAQSPTSFHNKVPLGYLVREGLKESIDQFDFENNTGVAKKFQQQYYQHNPRDARVLTDQEVEIIKNNQTDKKLRRLDIIPDDVPALFETTKNGVKPKYDYVSLYDTSNEKWRLYKAKGDRTYYEIDKLGDKPNVKEYNVNKDKTIGQSIIEENHSELEYNPFTDEDVDPDPVHDKSIPLNRAIENRDQISSEEYVRKVKDHVEDPYTIELLEFVQNTDMDFEIIMLSDQEIKNKWNQDYTSDAKYDSSEPNRIYLNEDVLSQESDNFIARTVLHEWVHKQTSKVYEMNENERTDKQQELMLNIYNLMNEAVEKDGQNAPPGIFNEDGSPNFAEFMSWAVANKEGQRWLKDIEVGDKNKSMLEKFVDMIADLVTSVIEASGFDISQNSTLRYTIRDTLNLIETTKVRDNPKSNPESKSKQERAEENESEENEFIDDEELAGYAENNKPDENAGELTDEQQEVYDNVMDFLDDESNELSIGENDEYVVKGKAGTGKTFTIAKIVEDIINDDEIAPNANIAISALTHKAINVLDEKLKDRVNEGDYETATIASLLGKKLDYETGEFTTDSDARPSIRGKDIVFIDEASMINRDAKDLLNTLGNNVKLVYIGDPGQLPPIDGESVVFNDVDKQSGLTERVRQGEGNPILDLSDEFWMATSMPSIDRINTSNSKGEVEFLTTDNAIESTKEEFKKAVNNEEINRIKAITYTNKLRKRINNEVRNYVFENPQEDYKEGDILTLQNNFSANGVDFFNSEDVIVEENLGTKRDRLSITGADPNLRRTLEEVLDNSNNYNGDTTFHRIKIRKQDGSSAIVDVPTQETLDLIEGDIKDAAIENGGINWVVYYKLKESFPDVDYGYAITSHKSQGSTYDTSVVFEQNIRGVRKADTRDKIKSLYTSITRASDKVIMAGQEAEGTETNTQETMSEDDIRQMFNETKDQRRPLEQQEGLDKTIGELRSTLSDRQKKIFDEYRTRFQTKC